MKLVELTITNFRHIEHLPLRFTDSVGRVRPVSLLVGPNTSGKTTILDAIGCALGPITEVFRPRPGFEYSTRNIVRWRNPRSSHSQGEVQRRGSPRGHTTARAAGQINRW